ncbi:MAG: MBL fold metallo-hydrolase [Sinimarinibacterium flocculans]|uniref:MBL fold metallo-hydrolase n=1 Tax=Sinimarinibacterium flocculans TaxID=985250 RepID=UPI003C6223C2
MSTTDKQPSLASLVQAGEAQTEAVAVTDFIFMVKDISNLYLVKTADGDLLVNAGFMDSAERNRALLAPHRSGPLRRIVITQGHPDHFGGAPALREAGTELIAQRHFTDTCADFRLLAPYFRRRSFKLWGSTIKRKGPPNAPPGMPPVIEPDVVVDREYGFEQGGRRFELLSTPGGETLDSLVVWMPDERVVFTGNLFGPVFLAVPNLVTVRGDRPRSVRRYLRALDRVRQLGAELLITGHGEPVRGAGHIRASLDRMHAAVNFIHDAVVDGMNAGKDVHTLMREIRLPETLKLGEPHGKVAWAVRSIWEEYSGWFHFDSTTDLYGVPRASVDADLVELAGGADALAGRAQGHADAGRPLEALHLLDIALRVEPRCAAALSVKKAALQQLQRESAGENLSETMWLRAEIAAVDAVLTGDGTAAP